jgi:hypothetical protein
MGIAFVLTLLTLAQPAVSLQQPGNAQAQDPTAKSDEPSLLSIKQIELASFKPQNLDPQELTVLAQRLLGRQFYVVENGGYDSAPVDNVHLLGSTLVLYDIPEQLKRLLATLQQLDQAGGDRSQQQAEELQNWQYAPRYLSLDSVLDVLRPMQRMLGPLQNVNNLSISPEQRLLIVRDLPARIAEIKALIERVDVPQDQATVTCWLLQGGAQAGNGSTLPPDLAEHLKRLLPGQTFHPVGFGMLQVTVSTQRPISLQMGPGAQMFELEMQPTAYDAQTGSLSVGSCALKQLAGDRTLFSTAVVLRGGAYTVIGASGAEPTLVAVQLQPVK